MVIYKYIRLCNLCRTSFRSQIPKVWTNHVLFPEWRDHRTKSSNLLTWRPSPSGLARYPRTSLPTWLRSRRCWPSWATTRPPTHPTMAARTLSSRTTRGGYATSSRCGRGKQATSTCPRAPSRRWTRALRRDICGPCDAQTRESLVYRTTEPSEWRSTLQHDKLSGFCDNRIAKQFRLPSVLEPSNS